MAKAEQVTIDGVTYSSKAKCCDAHGKKYPTIKMRMVANEWTFEQALTAKYDYSEQASNARACRRLKPSAETDQTAINLMKMRWV